MPPAEPLPRIAGPVALRRLRASDVPNFRSYRCDPVVGRFQGWHTMTEAEAVGFVAEMSRAELFVRGEWTQVAIAEADTDVLVGDLGLFLSANAHLAEIGFTLDPRFTGKGYATAAVREAVRLVFEQTDVQRVIGVTDARNLSSVRVLERAGMIRIESRETVFKGEPCIEWVYARQRGG
jgi:RimJ/RimL family protein N-acetyltransferase